MLSSILDLYPSTGTRGRVEPAQEMPSGLTPQDPEETEEDTEGRSLGPSGKKEAVLLWEHHVHSSRAFHRPPQATTMEKSLYLLLCPFHLAGLGDFPAQ